MARMASDRKDVIISMNPATLEVLGEVPLASAEDVKATVAKAHASFPAWAALSQDERNTYLLRARDWMLDHIDEVSELISRENGKPRTEALLHEVFTVADLITKYTKKAKTLLADRPISLGNPLLKATKYSRLAYEPLGVVSVVAPWNYPFAIPMSGIMFALMAGNTVVFKPASDVTQIGKKIDEIINIGGGLPPGVFQTVFASGRGMGNTLFEPPIKRIVFTGSTEVGRTIQQIAAKHFIPTSMELGGKDPMIVLSDADVDQAAQGAVWGAFTNCGQVCASVERVYVHKSIYDRFVDKVVALTRELRVGCDIDSDFCVDVGPMANEEQLGVVEDHVQDALKKGAKILAGGKRPEGHKGMFYEPTVLVNVDHTMKAVVEETFGPLLPIMPYDDIEEAIRLANDSPYGLTASVWTKDREKGLAIARRIESGTVLINDSVYSYGLCETPWQGVKESGTGRSHSDEGLLEFVYPKHINEDRAPGFMARRLWWYPYDKAVYEFLKLATKAFVDARHMPKMAIGFLTKKEYRKTLL